MGEKYVRDKENALVEEDRSLTARFDKVSDMALEEARAAARAAVDATGHNSS